MTRKGKNNTQQSVAPSSPLNNSDNSVSKSVTFDKINNPVAVPDILRDYAKAMDSEKPLEELQKSMQPLADPLKEFRELIKKAKFKE